MGSGFDAGRESVLGRLLGAKGAPFAPSRERYTVEGLIGRGGMGEVLLVTDRDLRRQVAMKVLRSHALGEDGALRFVSEAQATSQLEHPGIPPLHDIGIAVDGRVYFTMKLVRGRTLREVLQDLLLRRREVAAEYTLHRLVTILERIAETLHFAHESGVVHRDLKPENVMLGDYGEVHVMDWGLAHIAGETSGGDPIETARGDAGLESEEGTLEGTLPYMSPEQAEGDPTLDRRGDIFALGCLLYEVLALRSAYDPVDPDLLRKVREVSYEPVETRNPKRPVPEALAAVCRRAMARAREGRHPTAHDFARDLRAWLDGTSERDRRHAEAEALARRAAEAASTLDRRRAEVVRAEQDLEEKAKEFKPWQPLSEKGPLLDARRRAEQARTEVTLAFAETVKYLDAALVQESDHAGARAALARLWRGRLEEAEARADRPEAAYALATMRRYDDRPDDGTLSLASVPSGAHVVLHRFVEHDGVLVAAEPRELGRTPVGPVAIPMGSWLCVLTAPGFPEVRYPVHVGRNHSWSGTVNLRTAQEIGAGFVYVPGGPFLHGEGRRTERRELPDFAIQRFPVTLGDYVPFLDAVEAAEGADAALARAPHTPIERYLERTGPGTWVVTPSNVEGLALDRLRREHGEEGLLRLPVRGISWHDAKAYCEWKARTTRTPWRLPTEEEREKAARGVDGRRFPWGDLEDASLLKCVDARPEPAQPEPVGTFRLAASVYDMGDAAGGVWEWTDSWIDDRRTSRVIRGGAWGYPAASGRCANQGRVDPMVRGPYLGFRCARTLGGPVAQPS